MSTFTFYFESNFTGHYFLLLIKYSCSVLCTALQ